MDKKTYSVVWGWWRLNLSIGGKTLVAFLCVISVLAGGFYYFSTTTLTRQIDREAKTNLRARLKGAQRVYHARLAQMKFGMLQAGSEETVQAAVAASDSTFLRKLIRGYAEFRPYVDLWAVVDATGRVIARRGAGRGDQIEINGAIATALTHGNPVMTTEVVPRAVLAVESPRLAAGVGDNGLMQLTVTPVKRSGRVVGAFVTGILLNGYEWLPNAIYENLKVNSAVFKGRGRDLSVLSTALMPSSIFNPTDRLPIEIAERITEGREFLGTARIGGTDAYLAAEPIKDLSGRVIGALVVGKTTAEVVALVSGMKKSMLLVTLMGVVISLVFAGLAYRDTSKPISVITAAMDETAKGNLNVRTHIRTKDDFERIGEGFNQMVHSIHVRDERLKRFNELSKVLTLMDPATLLQKALSRMIELTGSSMGLVYRYDEKSDMLTPAVSYGINTSELKALSVGEGLAGECAAGRKTIVLKDITDKHISLEAGFAKIRPSGLAWFSMNHKERLMGVFVIGSLKPYLEDDIKHIDRLVAQVAVALDSAILHKEVERLAIVDSLTGLYNRRHFFKRLDSEFSGASRYSHPIAVIMIDLDDFKSINDNYGHQQGDRILIETSRILKEKTRQTDVWGRYGGEEFIGYVSHTDRNGVAIMAEKVRSSVEEFRFPGMNGKRVTISVGVALYPEGSVETIDDIIKLADDHLYKAKKQGKNRVVM